jgi:hypothetical protein
VFGLLDYLFTECDKQIWISLFLFTGILLE